MRPPIRIAYRHYQMVEVNGPRETVIGRYTNRWEANRAKKELQPQYNNRLIVRFRWA